MFRYHDIYVTDHDDDEDILDRIFYTCKKNEDTKLTESNKVVGYLNKVPNDYFCYKWTVSNISQYIQQPSKEECLQSPEFKTGANNENVWILKLIVGNDSYATKVQLHLISYKDPCDLYSFHLSILDRDNKKIINKEISSVEISKCIEGKMICEFNNLRESYYNMKIPVNKLTLFCEIISPASKKMKITKYNKTNDLKLFLMNEKLSDVTISVGETKFHLHKAILASRSAVFLAMFLHETKESKENLVEITDVSEKIMKKVILYIYTDEIENLEEDASDIFVVADKYGIEGLKSACIEELSNCLTSDNVFQILVLADTCNGKKLKINALNYIGSNLTELIDTPGYKMLRKKCPHLIEQILLAVAKRLQDL